MDLVTMSGRELQRIEVLSEVLARRRTEISAAAILGLSTRQTRQLLTTYRDGGGGALYPQGSWPHLEQPAYSWHPRVCDRTGSVALCRFRPEPGGGGSVREGRSQGLARDAAQVDGRGMGCGCRASSEEAFISECSHSARSDSTRAAQADLIGLGGNCEIACVYCMQKNP